MARRERQRTVPLYGLVVGVVLQLVAGVLAFLTGLPLVALVLFMVGIVGMGLAGDALGAS